MINTRRKFIKQTSGILPLLLAPSFLHRPWAHSTKQIKIDEINLFLINVTKERNFSFGVWKNRQHVMINIKGANHIGWGETKVSSNQPDFDLSKWSEVFQKLKGMTVTDAIEEVRNQFLQGHWRPIITEGLLMTLYDLMGKVENKPTVKIWGLEGEDPVPAIFCILEREEEMVVKQAQIAKDQNMHRYVKIKMFGDFETDKKNVTALRKFLGPDAFILGDPNRGYDHVKDLNELSQIMVALHQAGMDGVEDPSNLKKEELIFLQSNVGKLSIVPDHIMRPAAKSIKYFDERMGNFFNLHPNCMGTFQEINQMAKVIKESGKGIMIGDSSLVGAACTFWQQIAIGNKASWVEAMEKPQEQDAFINCIEEKATQLNAEGKVSVDFKPGFGLKVNETKLKSLADKYLNI
ncbi:MAG: mandelate racemase/muconate lactonizing enzyme family protein [Flavobacteriaceae bacterium]|jgi:L-alanine-DL-glutamate epimerase-like enolase superfamily enzyme|nr:mandelate racemase/muconate lactonizing enzyme family protein [Flavobacteriaceae bacterium]MBL6692597.1 mandelate racemase/muconate lactonizing enzyme family protein [Flavobacteriaceae bacterium]